MSTLILSDYFGWEIELESDILETIISLPLPTSMPFLFENSVDGVCERPENVPIEGVDEVWKLLLVNF